MLRRHFYSHIIETASLSLELGDMDLSQSERLDLLGLLDLQLHHTIMDAVLSELSLEDRRVFLAEVGNDNHDKIWELLKKKINNIEEKIQNAAVALTKELHKDINEAKNKK